MKNDNGFALIEVTLALLVIGIVGVSFFGMMRQLRLHRQKELTHLNEERIFYALGNFLRQTGRLPCPSDPSDLESWGFERRACQSFSTAQGVVPFHTLNLNESVAKNGRGLFFTYVVHPDMVQKSMLVEKEGRVYCKRRPQFPIEVLPHHTVSNRQSYDPIVVVLEGFNKNGGAFVKGKQRRQPFINKEDALSYNSGDNFVFYEPSHKNTQSIGRTLRYETKDNLAAYYGKVFCTSAQGS